jgi:L,D-transpeptidase ErfK/SrfK
VLVSVPAKQFPLILTLFLFILSYSAHADSFIGGKTTVVAQRRDCGSVIAARFGVDWKIVARENGLNGQTVCKAGQQLSINNLRIVPKVIEEGIIVNVPDRMLYFFKNSELIVALPVGLGLPEKAWQTPIGPFSIVRKVTNPTWFVPKSIQREMRQKGEPVRTVVPPGKKNPLGRYALYTSLENILIHETIWPSTVYRWRSHGCIRVSPEAMQGLFDQVETGTTGEVIYQPVGVAVREGRVFLQVARDIYRKIPSMDTEVKTRIEERGLSGTVDWVKVQRVTKDQTGIAEDVSQ